ncbi:MAG: peptidoglycan-associated lipoprotein Pal, partial [candidate division WOR-3 bacterium]
LMDESFFQMLNRLIEASLAGGDQQTAQALAQLQQEILPQTAVGQRLMNESAEVQNAMRMLQEASQKGLTREGLLDIFLQQKSEPALAALVSLTRSGLDYEFFAILSKRLESASGEEKQKLTDLRQKLLDLTAEIDRRMKERLETSRLLLSELLDAPNIDEAFQQHIGEIDEFFTEVLQQELQDIHFDFDKYNIRPGDAEILKKNLDWFKANPGTTVRVEGNCDERGTVEYNLALGQKRADSAKNYLVGLGVDAKRLQTVSYGKERPLCTEHNEACWAKNRNAQFVPIK